MRAQLAAGDVIIHSEEETMATGNWTTAQSANIDGAAALASASCGRDGDFGSTTGFGPKEAPRLRTDFRQY